MSWRCSDVDLTSGPLLQGQMRIGKLKVLLMLLLLVLKVWVVKPTYRKSWASNVIFELRRLFQGQMRIGKLKSACNSLVIGSRGLGCETRL